LKGLVDARAVTVADKQIVTMKLVGQDLALPKTLRGLVASRIARLSVEDRATLQAAAVLGDPMNAAVLSQMLGQAMGPLERSLATLKEREFVVHTGPSELRFLSPTVREVVVDALTHEASRAMHLAAGLALEKFLGDKAWEQAARIATHLYEAGEREDAASHFAKSAERRLEGRQLEAAARDYARAIELCDMNTRTPEELAKWLGGLSQAVRLTRSLPEAAEMCDRIVTRIDRAADLASRVRARVDAGRILAALHQFEAATKMFVDAERIAGDDDALVKPALVAFAELAGRQGDFKRSLEQLSRLEKNASALGDKLEEHKLLASLSQTHAAMGDRRAAITALDRAERLLAHDKTAACERQKLRGLVEYFARDYRAAALACEKAIDMARDAGLTYEVAVNLHNLGDALVRLDDYPRAYGAIQQSLALCDEAGFERLASHNRMFLAFLNAVAGDKEQETLLVNGLRYAEANDFTWDVIGGLWLLAQLHLRREEKSAAKSELEKLRTVASSAGNRVVLDDCDAALKKLDLALATA
jgi:tetratricopeptide (TPR) repeat protein